MTVQARLCWTWSEPKLLVLSCTGSYIIQVTKILKTHESERTEEDLTVLKNNKEVVKRIQKNKERKIKTEERTQEVCSGI